MPSTGADWIIRCTDHEKIDLLVKDLEPMATLHKGIIEADWNNWAIVAWIITDIYPELKRFKETSYKYFHRSDYSAEEQEEIAKQYQEFVHLVQNVIDRKKLLDRVIIKYNHEVEGNILISRELFESDFVRSKPKYDGEYSWDQLIDFKYKSEAEKQRMTDEIMARYAQTGKMKLHGLQFRMYESRWPMGCDDMMSFVFAEFPDYPELDGLCVELTDNENNLMEYKDPGRAAADYVIYPPSISLRYQNEDVVFKLLTWMNFFHFPEMKFDFGYGDNYGVKQEEIKKFHGNTLLKNKALIELMEYSYHENKYVIGDDYISDIPLIDMVFDTLVSPEKLEYRRKFAERLLGKPGKIKATFKNEVIYSDLYKIANKPFVAAPYFCEACGLHFGLSLERSIAAIKYIKFLRMMEMEASGFFFDIDLSKFDDENYQSEDDFRNIYFHAGFCSYCDSEKKWIEMRQILDGLD